MAGNFLVSADAEGTHSETSFAEDGLLLRELMEHLKFTLSVQVIRKDYLGGTSQSIATLTNAAVDNQLLDLGREKFVKRAAAHQTHKP